MSSPSMTAASRVVTSVSRTSVADQLHAQLRTAILSGSQAPGSLLPSERELAEQAGVNRQAVREALQRLRQAGLIDIVQGEGVRVGNWRSDATIAVLLDGVFQADGGLDPDIVESLLRMRLVALVDATRRLALSHRDDVVATLRAMVVEMRAEPADAPITPRFEFWGYLVDSCGNVAYRLAFNTQLGIAERLSSEVLAFLSAGAKLIDEYDRLVEAIAVGDVDAAALEADSILGPALRMFEIPSQTDVS
ncbi:MAG: GntR family transcriptional regulator [Ilumatobacteraceae bacterium]